MDTPASEAVDIAHALGEVGVDTVIYSLRPPYLAPTVEALGTALDR